MLECRYCTSNDTKMQIGISGIFPEINTHFETTKLWVCLINSILPFSNGLYLLLFSSAWMRLLLYLHSHINGLVQEICNSSALAMELCLSCTNPLICWCLYSYNDHMPWIHLKNTVLDGLPLYWEHLIIGQYRWIVRKSQDYNYYISRCLKYLV